MGNEAWRDVGSDGRDVLDLTVLTATIPGREGMLLELSGCVSRQTVLPHEWIIERDDPPSGSPVPIFNRHASEVKTEWLMFAGDDDLMSDTHLETLAGGIRPGVDVVYTWFEVGDSKHLASDLFQI